MKFKPHPYQTHCINQIIEKPFIGLFLDMGLGKTAIALSAIYALRYHHWAVARVLIIAPKKVAEATWQAEAAKWDTLARLRICPVLGTKADREKALGLPGDIWVINRENVEWLVKHYQAQRKPWPFDFVVVDESSSFKNHRAKRFMALRAVRPQMKRMVLLTGTPAPNGLMDLWAQLYLLDGGERLGKTMTSYRDQYFRPDKRSRDVIWSYAPKKGAKEQILSKIEDICISMRAEDYLQLPDYLETDIPVKLTPGARKAYQQLERETLLQIDPETVVRGQAAVLANKLLQLCNGAVYTEDGEARQLHTCKVEALLELTEQLHGEHALVFYAYQHDLRALQAALKKTGLRVRKYQGAADAQAWNAGEIDLLLAHPASCAYGLNLQAGGRHVIWFGLTVQLELYQQANKRLHRQGQPYPVVVHHLVVQDSMDEQARQVLSGKAQLQDAVLAALTARIHEISGQKKPNHKTTEKQKEKRENEQKMDYEEMPGLPSGI